MEMNSNLTMIWIWTESDSSQRHNIGTDMERRRLDLNSSLYRINTGDSRLTPKLLNMNISRSVLFPRNTFYHEPGWNLKHKLHSVLVDLIDAVFWPVLALQSSTLYK